MRPLIALLALVFTLPAAAQPKKATTPPASTAATKLGDFEDWVAAEHQESGQKVCYAFTYAKRSIPTIPGRDKVVLTVAERASGRDAVAIAAGFNYAQGAAVTVQVDNTGLDFYTAQRDAFARDGKATVAAFQKGSEALARSPAPHGEVVDNFSLKGFSAAYVAINKACPAK
jgi:Invasion associated locus B (IalB) protein